MNKSLKFAAWAALFAGVLYMAASLFTGSGRDDQLLLDAVLTGLVLSGLRMVWKQQKEIEEKLDKLLNKKKDEYEE